LTAPFGPLRSVASPAVFLFSEVEFLVVGDYGGPRCFYRLGTLLRSNMAVLPLEETFLPGISPPPSDRSRGSEELFGASIVKVRLWMKKIFFFLWEFVLFHNEALYVSVLESVLGFLFLFTTTLRCLVFVEFLSRTSFLCPHGSYRPYMLIHPLFVESSLSEYFSRGRRLLSVR